MNEPLHVYVKRLRQARGRWFSQNELARRANIAPSTVHRLERGQDWKIGTLRAIAPHLGVRLADLLLRAAESELEDEGPAPDVEAAVAQVLARAGYSDDARTAILFLIRLQAPVSASTPVSS